MAHAASVIIEPSKKKTGNDSIRATVEQTDSDFDPLSLILLLEHHGYSKEQVLFRSHPNICSQNSLFEGIEFKQEPSPQVTVSVNMGLLGSQTCLPSYLFKQLEQASAEAFQFLQFFDHSLLMNFFRSLYPEQDTRLFADPDAKQRGQFLLLNLRAPCTLRLMLRLIFPELEARVEKAMLPRNLRTRSFIIGSDCLGTNHVLGNTFASVVQGLRIHLFSESESTMDGTPWAKVVTRRLEERLFPLLKVGGVELEIFLVLRNQRSWAKLSKGSFLGYDQFKGGHKQTRRLLVFSGTVQE